MNAVQTATVQPVVSILNSQIVTTSLNVAQVFEKRHSDVLRAIDATIKSAGESGRRNFALANYTDAQGKTRKAYNLTKDGTPCEIRLFTTGSFSLMLNL